MPCAAGCPWVKQRRRPNDEQRDDRRDDERQSAGSRRRPAQALRHERPDGRGPYDGARGQQGGRRCELRHPGRRDARAGGRIGLGKIDPGPRRRRVDAGDVRAEHHCRAVGRGSARQGAQGAVAARPDGVPGSLFLAQPQDDGAGRAGRAAAQLRHRARQRSRAPGARSARCLRAQRQRHDALSAGILRRPTPAHRHRAGPDRAARISSSPTSRCRPSTSRSRRRSSTCCRT